MECGTFIDERNEIIYCIPIKTAFNVYCKQSPVNLSIITNIETNQLLSKGTMTQCTSSLRDSQSLSDIHLPDNQTRGRKEKVWGITKAKSTLDKPMRDNGPFKISSSILQAITLRFRSHSSPNNLQSQQEPLNRQCHLRFDQKQDDDVLKNAGSTLSTNPDIHIEAESYLTQSRCWPRSKSCASSLDKHLSLTKTIQKQSSTELDHTRSCSKQQEDQEEGKRKSSGSFQLTSNEDKSCKMINNNETFTSIERKGGPYNLDYSSSNSFQRNVPYCHPSKIKKNFRPSKLFRRNTTSLITESHYNNNNNSVTKKLRSSISQRVSKVKKRRHSEPTLMRQNVHDRIDEELLMRGVEIQRRNAICESSPEERKQLLALLKDYTMVKNLQSYNWI